MTHIKTCIVCGNPFTPYRPHEIACNHECLRQYRMEQKRVKRKMVPLKQITRICAYELCKKPFIVSCGGQMYCSPLCQKGQLHLKNSKPVKPEPIPNPKPAPTDLCAEITQPCIDCYNAGRGGCSWDRCFKPVNGWDAVHVPATEQDPETWNIKMCPEWMPDRRKRRARSDGATERT